jgi:2,4-dienoyl-CoA reductase-like NADH-dependent reductase (Old Yellow Enzyme family)
MLPNGAVLGNRIAKAAMTEQLGTRSGDPTPGLDVLYRRWAASGAGLLITGNAVVDRGQLVEPYNVVLDDRSDHAAFARWAAAARSGGGHAWLQLNHPGRQALRAVTRRSVAPSAVRTRYWFMFAPPRALDADEITNLINAFGNAAALAERAGFTGVQLHAAHGFLVNQFLSPLSNTRSDQWGGPLQNRMRFLLECVRSIRGSVAPSTAVSVKLNSADFQRGGFTNDEAMEVIAALNGEGVDLLEVTGGNYEAPKSIDDVGVRRSTREREAHFLDYARRAKTVATMPVMLTGGLRTVETMRRIVVDGDVDIVGLARPMAVNPDLPAIAVACGTTTAARPRRTGLHHLDLLLESPWHAAQIRRLAAGHDPRPRTGATATLASLAVTRARWRLGLER